MTLHAEDIQLQIVNSRRYWKFCTLNNFLLNMLEETENTIFILRTENTMILLLQSVKSCVLYLVNP